MAHKHLNDIGIKEDDLPWNWSKSDERQEEWKKDRKELGFDERDTWNLNYTLTLLIYERLKHYRKCAPVEMDKIDFAHVYEVNGEKFAYGTIIDRILKSFETRLTKDEMKLDDDDTKEFEKCWELLGIIHWSLWW